MSAQETQEEFEKIFSNYVYKTNAVLSQTIENAASLHTQLESYSEKLAELRAIPLSEDAPPELVRRVNESSRKLVAHGGTNTGSFIYMFALFEQFLTASVSLFAKSSEQRADAYFQIFRRVAQQRNKDGDTRLIEAGLHGLDKQLGYINELPIFDIAELMFAFSRKDSAELFSRYVELRERRNLLMHRTDTVDERYVDVISKALNLKSSKLEAFLSKSFYETHSRESLIGVNAEANIGYVIEAHRTLFSLATAFYQNTLKADQADNQISLFPGSIIHDMMLMHLENKMFPLTVVLEEMSKAWVKFKEDKVLISDFDKANLVIALKYCELTNPNKKTMDTDAHDDIYSAMIADISDQNIKKLLSHYATCGSMDLAAALRTYSRKTNTGLDVIHDWFLAKAHNIKFN